MKLELVELMQAGFYGLLSLVALQVAGTLRDLKKSIDDLNVRIAVVIERMGSHEQRLKSLEDYNNAQSRDV